MEECIDLHLMLQVLEEEERSAQEYLDNRLNKCMEILDDDDMSVAPQSQVPAAAAAPEEQPVEVAGE